MVGLFYKWVLACYPKPLPEPLGLLAGCSLWSWLSCEGVRMRLHSCSYWASSSAILAARVASSFRYSRLMHFSPTRLVRFRGSKLRNWPSFRCRRLVISRVSATASSLLFLGLVPLLKVGCSESRSAICAWAENELKAKRIVKDANMAFNIPSKTLEREVGRLLGLTSER